MIVRELITKLGFKVDETKLQRMQKSVDNLKRGMIALKIAAGFAFVGVIKASGDFEYNMNRVQVLTRATAEEFKALRDQAKQLGIETQFSATQAADAMGFLAQAGFKANDILGAMSSVLNLAAASGADLAFVADKLSNIMTQFEIPASEAASAVDILAYDASNANTNIAQLAEAMSYTGGLAHALGLSVSETTAMLAQMGNAGVQASRAGTGLAMAMRRLLDSPTDVAKALNNLGVEASDGAGGLRNMIDIIGDLNKAGATTKDIAGIFGARATEGMIALISQGAAGIRKMQLASERATGEAERQAKARTEGYKGAMLALKSAAEGLAIEIGDSGLLGAVTKLIQGLTKLARSVAGWDLWKMRGALYGISIALGFIFATSVVSGLMTVIALVKLLGAQIMLTWAKALWLPALIVAAVGIIVLVIQDVYTLIRGGDSVLDKAVKFWWKQIKRLFGKVRTGVGDLNSWWESLKERLIGSIVDFAIRAGDAVKKYFLDNVMQVLKILTNPLEFAIDVARGDFKWGGTSSPEKAYSGAMARTYNGTSSAVINLNLPPGTTAEQGEKIAGIVQQEIARNNRMAMGNFPQVEG